MKWTQDKKNGAHYSEEALCVQGDGYGKFFATAYYPSWNEPILSVHIHAVRTAKESKALTERVYLAIKREMEGSQCTKS